MPDRNWRHHFFIGGITLGIISFAWWQSPTVPSTEECPTSNTHTEKQYRVSRDPDGQYFLSIKEDQSTGECDEIADKEANQANSLTVVEADLLAQERMAYWTFSIGVFTAIGLGLLYSTFYETRRAVEETRDIGEAQTRAWVGVINTTHTIAETEKGRVGVIFGVQLQNFGASPALKCSVQLQTLATAQAGEINFPEFEPRSEKSSAVIWPKAPQRGLCKEVVPYKIIEQMELTGHRLFLLARVTYRDVNQDDSEPPRETYIVTEITLRIAFNDLQSMTDNIDDDAFGYHQITERNRAT